MSIFDEQAIVAAARALDDKIVQQMAWSNDRAAAVLRAAEASLRERGMLREGEAYENDPDDKGHRAWSAVSGGYKDFEDFIPVAIIRLSPDKG